MADHDALTPEPATPHAATPGAPEPRPAESDHAHPVRAGERLGALDTLRGFALLGILFPNIFYFAWPMTAGYDPSIMGPSPWNGIAHQINSTVFFGKFMMIFAMLFGAGVVFFDRKSPGDKLSTGAGLWYRRMAWMLFFGVCHAVLLWYGDILVWYSMAGLTAVWWVRRFPPKALIAMGLGMHLIGTALITSFMLFAVWAIAQGHVPIEQIAGDTDGEIAITLGGYFGLMAFRVSTLVMYWFILGPMFAIAIVGLMCVGIALTRLGVLTGEKSARFYATAAAILLPVGAATTYLGYDATFSAAVAPIPAMLWQCYAQFLGLPLGLGYAAVVLLLVRLGALGFLTSALAAVGRMAFTSYISQTLICTTFFYGWGLGNFASVPFPQLFAVIAGVWTFNIVFAIAWLRVFRFGPLEWLWRSLTYWELQPMLRAR
jgi:uncharacterized protein